MRAVLLGVALIATIVLTARPVMHAVATVAGGSPCADAAPVPAELSLPAVVPPGEPVEIEHQLLDYLQTYKYRDLGWCHDKGVRDTGPYLDGISYGVHPAVQIWYSPEMIEWLRGGRKGVPKDGAVMIKEQYGNKPALFFKGKPEADLQPTDWTIMIRRSGASHDGWFWAEVFTGMFPTGGKTAYPWAGFGLYCLRCHASAERAMTFASLENVAGFPGTPITYKIDDTWKRPAAPPPTPPGIAAAVVATATPRAPLSVQTFPPEPLDTFVAHAHVPHMFLTSDQCMGCHSSAPGKPIGPVMSASPPPGKTGGPLNLSEYGEWRWSPMALAGRDPVFFAQFEGEMAYLASIHDRKASATLQKQVTGICMTCHAAMGSRQLALDRPGALYEPAMSFDGDPSHPNFHYGGLARDGISCSLCHHAAQTVTPARVASLPYFLDHKINGTFDTGPADKLFGPFADLGLVTHPMNEALGAKPKHDAYIQSPRMCGSCHTINLPIVDKPPVGNLAMESHNVEQATYLEWLNSAFQTEYGASPRARSCQACHMPAGVTDEARGISLAHIASKIALVEDDSYPETTNAAPAKDLRVLVRKTGYARHELLGLNAFLLTLFKQYPDVMGVRTSDYMSGSATDLDDAIGHVVRQAQKQTATVSVRTRPVGDATVADVEVVNLTGHKFPSGVAFRRAFLDVAFYDKRHPDATPFFESGATDDRGRILGADGKPLPSEFFARDARGRERYQEHFDEADPVTQPGQVQIFEELTQDRRSNFTFSFIRRDHEFKDNRIEPLGFTRTGPTPDLPAYFLEATYPKGRAASDPRYFDGRGHAVVRYRVVRPNGVPASDVGVRATLYYESWEPAFVALRASGKGSAAQRFAALVENVDLRGTALQNWKIRIASAHR
jgi:mono/diheme cytochrome c family protein